jgi:hypothetical protein
MKEANLKPDEISYSTLINKSLNFQQSERFFKEMKEAKLEPDEIAYNTLINKSQIFEQQKLYYKEFLQKFPLQKGNLKSEKNYNYLFFALFKRVKTKQDFEFVKSEIYSLGLKLDDYTTNFYMNLEKKFM